MAKMRVMMPGKGDQTLTWEPKTDDEVKARKVFNQLMSQGRLAYEVKGEESTQIRTFKPEAEEIVIVAPVAGG